MIDFKKLIRSFRYAFRGLSYAWAGQSFRFQVAIAALVLAWAFYIPLQSAELMALVLTIALVLSLEMVNTALERTLDMVRPQEHPEVRIIKDVSAAAVLIASLAALVIGLKLFLPYLL